jgi:hypothetical protein
MPGVGVEPTRAEAQGILSRIPTVFGSRSPVGCYITSSLRRAACDTYSVSSCFGLLRSFRVCFHLFLSPDCAQIYGESADPLGCVKREQVAAAAGGVRDEASGLIRATPSATAQHTLNVCGIVRGRARAVQRALILFGLSVSRSLKSPHSSVHPDKRRMATCSRTR